MVVKVYKVLIINVVYNCNDFAITAICFYGVKAAF